MSTALYRLSPHLLTWFELFGDAFRTVRGSQSTRRAAGAPPAPAPASAREPSTGGSPPARVSSDAGMTTAEYAVGTVAAVAFAVVLFKVVQSPAVHGRWPRS